MSNETKTTFTPGPWLPYKGKMNMDSGLNPFFRGIVALLKHSGEDDDVVVILDRNESATDYEANANLIAAAPELYEACRTIQAVKHCMMFVQAHAPEFAKEVYDEFGVTSVQLLAKLAQDRADAALAKAVSHGLTPLLVRVHPRPRRRAAVAKALGSP